MKCLFLFGFGQTGKRNMSVIIQENGIIARGKQKWLTEEGKMGPAVCWKMGDAVINTGKPGMNNSFFIGFMRCLVL